MANKPRPPQPPRDVVQVLLDSNAQVDNDWTAEVTWVKLEVQ